MPKPARSEEEIQKVRDKILDSALEIIYRDGFDNLSMSKLGKKMGMTAANIYNYYKNKDELYIAIVTKGNILLYEKIETAVENQSSYLDKAQAFIREYINFGIKYVNYYNIMFNMPTPKYRDYLGTPQVKAAEYEKQTSMQIFEYANKLISEFFSINQTINEKNPYLITLKIWSQLHGIITLYNSRILHEIDDNPEELIRTIGEDLILSIIQEDK